MGLNTVNPLKTIISKLKNKKKTAGESLIIDHKDFPKILHYLGLYHMVEKGEVACFICGEVLKPDTVGGIDFINKRIVLICNKPPCTIEYTKFKARLIALGYKIK